MSTEFWLRLAAVPVAAVMWVALGYVLSPVSKAIKRWLPDSALKRFLLTPAGARWGSQQSGDTTIAPNRHESVVKRLPPPLKH